jgi:hypothetical protein
MSCPCSSRRSAPIGRGISRSSRARIELVVGNELGDEGCRLIVEARWPRLQALTICTQLVTEGGSTSGPSGALTCNRGLWDSLQTLQLGSLAITQATTTSGPEAAATWPARECPSSLNSNSVAMARGREERDRMAGLPLPQQERVVGAPENNPV